MKRRARNNAEVANFVMGCRDASQLQREIHAIMDDEPIDLDRLQLCLREVIGAVKRARVTGLGSKRLRGELTGFEQYCKSVLETIIGQQH